jgi:hypothetical protein
MIDVDPEPAIGQAGDHGKQIVVVLMAAQGGADGLHNPRALRFRHGIVNDDARWHASP